MLCSFFDIRVFLHENARISSSIAKVTKKSMWQTILTQFFYSKNSWLVFDWFFLFYVYAFN